jgi:Cof subfamily protein (haloacid dehalogenase superfamily)
VSGKKDIKLIALDIDGTLVDIPNLSTVPERVKKAIKDAMAAGIRFCFCTARPYNAVKKVADETGINDYWICNCGANVFINGKDMAGLSLERRILKKVLQMVIDTDGSAMFAGKEYCERPAKGDPGIKLSADDKNDFIAEMEDKELFDLIKNDKFYGVVLLKGRAENTDVLLETLKQYLGSDLSKITTITTSFEMVVIMKKEVSKGGALLMLADHLGIKPENIMAIGDDELDVSMLNLAGLGITLESGKASLKDMADQIVPGVHEGGVADAICNYAIDRE